MKNLSPETILVHGGRRPFDNHGIVNPPVYHCSTVLFATLDDLEYSDRHPYDGVNYGRIGTPTSAAFEEALSDLEGGYRAVATSSGLAAITTALMAFTRAGDHILVADCVYGPTRRFCRETLAHYGVAVEFFDPSVGAGISALMRPETKVVYLESPGSLTFEVQDVPAIAAAARAGGAVTLIDNTWGTPLHFRAFDHGVDISIHAATKYIVGHADAMLGAIVCRDEALFNTVKRTAVRLGNCAGPDDLYLGLRGLRTLAPRLKTHEANGLALADWFGRRSEVTRILHPALPGDPGHALWKRDFTGACGLFAFVMDAVPRPALTAMLDDMELFGLGYSWGGFESLILPVKPAAVRSATTWSEAGTVIRVHAGLENIDDLIRDLEAGFERLRLAL